MHFDFSLVLFIVGVQFVAGLLKTLAGFGNGSISMSLLAIPMESRVATPGNALVDVLLNGFFALKYRAFYRIKKYLIPALFTAAGAIIGALVLKASPPWILRIIVGCTVIGLGVLMIFDKRLNFNPYKWYFKPYFLFGGLIGGMFGINMFFIPVYRKMASSAEELKGGACFTYTIELAVRLTIYFCIGLVNTDAWYVGLYSGIGLALGMLAGTFLERFVNHKAAEVITVGVMMLGGVSVIARAILSLVGIL